MATHDGALALGAQAHGLSVVGATVSEPGHFAPRRSKPSSRNRCVDRIANGPRPE